jgi:Zn-dependent peptidase ImmA (M78 family)
LRKLRGAYFSDEIGATVMLAKGLPEDPMVFTMGHELKHHLVDRDLALSYCDASNESDPIEIGAEIFAAELIYPEQDFVSHLSEMGLSSGRCEPRHLVDLKRSTRTTLSYAGLAKRAEFLEFAPAGSLAGIRWKKLEEGLYGPPIYKRFRRR